MVHAFLYVKELSEKDVKARLILKGKAIIPKLYADGKGLVGKKCNKIAGGCRKRGIEYLLRDKWACKYRKIEKVI